MTILSGLLCVAAHVPSIMLRYVPFASKLKPEEKKALLCIYAIALLLNFILCVAVEQTIGISIRFYKLNLLLFCMLMSFCNYVVVRKWEMEHLFVFGLVAIIVLMILSVGAWFIELLPLPNLQTQIILENVTLLLLFAALYLPSKKLICTTITPFLEYNRRGYWKNMWFIPIAMMLASFLFVPLEDHITSIVQLASRLLIGAATLFICRSIAYDYGQFQVKEVLGQQLRLEKQYYVELSQKVLEVRKMRHDLKHHLAVLQALMETDNKEKLRQYCAQLEVNQAMSDWIPYSGNLAADGILYHYMQQARQNDVTLDLACSFEKITMEDVDLCCLLGNALCNAMEACLRQTQGERRIRVTSCQQGEYLLLTVDNTYDGHVTPCGSGFLSSKGEGREGIGVASMQSICKKYGGTCRFEAGQTLFQASFLLG